MQPVSLFRKALRFIFLLVLVNSIGFLASSYMTGDNIQWYNNLTQSALTPPRHVFGLVWSVLLLLQAVAAFLVWGKASPRYFALQLGLNMLWSFVFFFLHQPIWALFVLILFIWALIMNIKTFAKSNKLSGWFLVPTLLWSLFAFYLNAFIIFA